MQTHSLEQVQTAIRNAQAAGDARAVATLKDYEEDIKRDIAMLRALAPREEAGVIENITSGIGAGIVDVGELALLGGAAALEEEAELAAREKIKAGAAALRPEGGDPDSISYQISQPLGAIAGIATISVGATTSVTLTSNNGASDEARSAILHIKGTVGGTHNTISLIVPANKCP